MTPYYQKPQIDKTLLNVTSKINSDNGFVFSDDINDWQRSKHYSKAVKKRKGNRKSKK